MVLKFIEAPEWVEWGGVRPLRNCQCTFMSEVLAPAAGNKINDAFNLIDLDDLNSVIHFTGGLPVPLKIAVHTGRRGAGCPAC